MPDYKISADDLQVIADNNKKIHDLSDKIYEILKRVQAENEVEDTDDCQQKFNIKDSTINFSGGTHHHHYQITGQAAPEAEI